MPEVTPTVQLKWYQRILVNSNKKLVMTSSANRVISIDWCKGFAIFFIVVDHSIWIWLQSDMVWYARFLFLWLEILGPTTFLFFAGVNTTMAYRQARVRKIPHALIHYETFRRMMGLLFVAILSRLIGFFISQGSMSLFTVFFQWDILQAIAFSVILLIPLLKLSPLTRLLIAAVILGVSYPLYQSLLSYQAESLPAQILIVLMYAPYLYFGSVPSTGGMTCPLFPMIAYAIIGSIIIDLLLPLINSKRPEKNSTGVIKSQNNDKNSPSQINPFKLLLVSSLAIILVSVIFGFGPNTDPFFQDEATLVLNQLHMNPIFLSWDHLPVFLLGNHPMNILFKVGYEACFFLLPFYYFEKKKSENYSPSRSTSALSFFGQFSLSYYTYSFLFALLPFKFDPLGCWLGGFVSLTLMSLLFRFYLRKAYGGGLVEFVMATVAIIWSIPPSIKDIQAVYPEKVELLPT